MISTSMAGVKEFLLRGGRRLLSSWDTEVTASAGSLHVLQRYNNQRELPVSYEYLASTSHFRGAARGYKRCCITPQY